MCRPEYYRGSRFAIRVALFAFLFLLACGFGHLRAYDLATSDGLTVQVDEAGLVTGVQVGGDELLTGGVTGGFSLTDFTGIGGTNLLANSGFEGGFTHWGDNIYFPDNWSLITATGSADNIMLLADTAGPYEGLNALRFVTTQSGDEDDPLEPDVLEVASDTFAVEAGVTYHCSSVCSSPYGYARGSSWPYSAILYLDWYDGDQALISSDTVFKVQQTFYSWTLFSGWAEAPAGAASASVRIYVTGNTINYGPSFELLFDDLHCFREPDGIRDIPVTGTVIDTSGILDLQAVDVGGRGLDVSARMEPLADRIEISGTVTPTAGNEGQDRAIDLTFTLPVDTSSLDWYWYDDPHKSYLIYNQYIYDEVVAADAISSNLKMNVYNLSCITDGDHVLNIGRDPDVVRPYYVQYEAEDDLYIVRFQLGLAAERDHASFDFILYTSSPNGDFRGALQDYYEIYTGYGRLRQLEGQPMVGGINGGRTQSVIGKPYETDPQDFAVRYYTSFDARDVAYLVDTVGLLNLFYIQPWCVLYAGNNEDPPPPYVEFLNVVNGQQSALVDDEPVQPFPSDFLVNINDMTLQDYLLYSVRDYPGQNAYQYFGAIYINTEDAAPSFGNRYLDYLDDVYDYFVQAMGNGDYLHGVMMDLSNIGCFALDASRSRFASAGYDLTYSPVTFKPALWNLNAFQNFMGRLQDHLEANYPERDIIAANLIEIGSIFSAANQLDTFGFECSPISGWNWGTKNLDYRRIIAGSKPFSPVPLYSRPLPFDEPSNEYYKGMCDMYNIALLYAFYLDPHSFTELNNKDLEELRDLSAGVVPYIGDFMKLGWNPQHQVQLVNEDDQPISDSMIMIERYGPNDEFDSGETAYVVINYNHNSLKVFDTIFARPPYFPAFKDFRLKIDLDDIGMTEPMTLEEMTATMHDMAPVIPPNLTLSNNGDGTVTITGTVDWRDTLVLKLVEYTPDTTPPAVPTGVEATVILP